MSDMGSDESSNYTESEISEKDEENLSEMHTV
jgi:hypothetical protein